MIKKKGLFGNAGLKELAQALTANINGNTITGLFNGRTFQCRYIPPAKNTPPRLAISLNSASAANLIIRKEGKFDNISKKLGIVKELQTGDSEFDSKLFIETMDKNFASLLLSDKLKRQNIKIGFDAYNVEKISILTNKTETTIAGRKPNNIKPSEITDLLTLLSSLISSEPYTRMVERSFLHRASTSNLMLLALIPSFISTAMSVFLFIAGFVNYKPLDGDIVFGAIKFSLPLTVITAGVIVFALFKYVRERYDAHKVILTCAILYFLCFASTGIGYFIFTNGYFDKSKAETHEVIVKDKTITRGKNSAYYLHFMRWDIEGSFKRISVSNDFYSSVNIGEMVAITTKNGYRGYEWIVKIEKLK
ncbi:hypothetical protein MCHI_000647 [Candidatus Magnetoovum chiemensis]|nr:hypothetical protein MCHI_000647 [Candidatus Magnetoovum chiemensis]